MREIYELKAQGLTLKQVIGRLELKVSESTLARRLKTYCEENKLIYHKNKCGRKKINLKIKNND